MTVRKILISVIIFAVIFSVLINTFIFASLTDKYFKNYLEEDYISEVDEIINYASKAMKSLDGSSKSISLKLKEYINDPIVEIQLYDINGNKIAEANDHEYLNYNHHGKRMTMMMQSNEEIDVYDVLWQGRLIGNLRVTRYDSVGNSMTAQMFKASLFANSGFSIGIAMIFSVFLGIFISGKISKSLKETAKLAESMENDDFENRYDKSNILEIQQIRKSLKELGTRLKIKQKSRKTLTDQLIHQTRTPLTILKSHIEAVEDGIIDLNEEELNICKIQIDNVTAIISNLSGMIDGEGEIDDIVIENFEFNKLINQIIIGLKGQFDKKNIKIILDSNEKIKISSDKYKLSQSIYNIITNAYKYTKENGFLKINYKKEKEDLILTIEDSGEGISENEISDIFKAYYRGKSSFKIPGEGIGLYVVKENMSQINGKVEASSKKGVGSVFKITIPLNIRID